VTQQFRLVSTVWASQPATEIHGLPLGVYNTPWFNCALVCLVRPSIIIQNGIRFNQLNPPLKSLGTISFQQYIYRMKDFYIGLRSAMEFYPYGTQESVGKIDIRERSLKPLDLRFCNWILCLAEVLLCFRNACIIQWNHSRICNLFYIQHID
jgi:hypothetical protein